MKTKKDIPVRLEIKYVPLPPEKEAQWREGVKTLLVLMRRARDKCGPPQLSEEEEEEARRRLQDVREWMAERQSSADI